MLKIKIEKRTHKGYLEIRNANRQLSKRKKIGQLFGNWQYIYSSRGDVISLVLLKNYFRDKKDFYEIYCLEGDLFKEVERYDTKKEAERRITELFMKRSIFYFIKRFILNFLKTTIKFFNEEV